LVAQPVTGGMVSWQKPSAPQVALPAHGCVASQPLVHCWFTHVRVPPHSVLNTHCWTVGTQVPLTQSDPVGHACVASQSGRVRIGWQAPSTHDWSLGHGVAGQPIWHSPVEEPIGT
jgi:hypothetical protein